MNEIDCWNYTRKPAVKATLNSLSLRALPPVIASSACQCELSAAVIANPSSVILSEAKNHPPLLSDCHSRKERSFAMTIPVIPNEVRISTLAFRLPQSQNRSFAMTFPVIPNEVRNLYHCFQISQSHSDIEFILK